MSVVSSSLLCVYIRFTIIIIIIDNKNTQPNRGLLRNDKKKLFLFVLGRRSYFPRFCLNNGDENGSLAPFLCIFPTPPKCTGVRRTRARHR